MYSLTAKEKLIRNLLELWGLKDLGEPTGEGDMTAYTFYSHKWITWSRIDKFLVQKENLHRFSPIELGLMMHSDHIPITTSLVVNHSQRYSLEDSFLSSR